MLVNIDKFIFSTYFMVLDIKKDQSIPMILYCLFLVIGHALIDIYEGELTLQFNREEVNFNIALAISFLETTNTCLQVELHDHLQKENFIMHSL